LIDKPNFRRYSEDGEATRTVRIYYEDLMLGGGSIFADKYFGDPDVTIKSPLGSEWSGIHQRLVAGLESGKTAVGGYYNIQNIQ